MDIENTRRFLLALAAGDTLGATTEFQSLDRVANTYDATWRNGWPFQQVGGGPFGWRAGQGTDDTDMATAIVRAFLKSGGKFDGDAVAAEFVAWRKSGPRDIGGTTIATVSALASGSAWYVAGVNRYKSSPAGSANGSLMRNGVVPALCDFDVNESLRVALLQSIITHADPVAVLCCMMQAWLICRIMGEGTADGLFGDDDVNVAVQFAYALGEWHSSPQYQDPFVRNWFAVVGDKAWAAALEKLGYAFADFDEFDPYDDGHHRGGHSLFTLQVGVWAARWAALNEPYTMVPEVFPVETRDAVFNRTGADVLGWVAMLGGDSDTYGATAGPLVDAVCGGLPKYMTDRCEAGKLFDADVVALTVA